MFFIKKPYAYFPVLILSLLILTIIASTVRRAESKSIEIVTTDRFLLLSESISPANITDFKNLIVDGADIDAYNRYGATALHMAAGSGNMEVVEILLSVKADINRVTKDDGVTALYLAAQNGYVDIVMLLIRAKANLFVPRRFDYATPLWIASQEGHSDVVRLLIKAGADVNTARRTDGANALYMAAQNGHPSVVKLLIDAGADINKAVSEFGVTPIYIASQNGHMECVSFLVLAGADVNIARGNDEVSPLWIASQEGHLDVVNGLLSLKGEPETRSTVDERDLLMADMETVIDRAYNEIKDRSLLDEDELDVSAGALALLLEGQAELDKTAKAKEAALNVPPLVDVDFRNSRGYTPLMLASLRGHVEVVVALLDKGADVNARSNIGMTSLMLAAEHGNSVITRELLSRGADVSVRSDEGKTAVNFAEEREHKNIAKLLTKSMKALAAR